jgi:hypothetical protein
VCVSISTPRSRMNFYLLPGVVTPILVSHKLEGIFAYLRFLKKVCAHTWFLKVVSGHTSFLCVRKHKVSEHTHVSIEEITYDITRCKQLWVPLKLFHGYHFDKSYFRYVSILQVINGYVHIHKVVFWTWE